MIYNEKSLNLIYIRARDKDGHWGSFSLETLIRSGQQNEVYFWFLDKLNDLVGIGDERSIGKMKRKQVVTMLNILDRCGVQITQLKADADKNS